MLSSAPVHNCPLCPRLAAFRAENAQQYPDFFNGAVPSFGGLDAEFLIIGLAPGLKGANATGRPFTGDFAGDVLYPALLKAGLAVVSDEFGVVSTPTKQSDLYRNNHSQLTTHHSQLRLQRTRITNAVRCVPPENKPTPQEITTCNAFLTNEIAAMPKLKLILTLGLVSHKATLKALGLKQSAHKFTHGKIHSPLTTHHPQLINSYHTSRYNMNTGRLTVEMFDAVIAQAKGLLG